MATLQAERVPSLRVSQLKDEATKLGLDPSGKKDALVSRILTHLTTPQLPLLPNDVLKQISNEIGKGQSLQTRLATAYTMRDRHGLEEMKKLMEPTEIFYRFKNQTGILSPFEAFDRTKLQTSLDNHFQKVIDLTEIYMHNEYIVLIVSFSYKENEVSITMRFREAEGNINMRQAYQFDGIVSASNPQKVTLQKMTVSMLHYPSFYNFEDDRDMLLGLQWLKRYIFPQVKIATLYSPRDVYVLLRYMYHLEFYPENHPLMKQKVKELQKYIQSIWPVIKKIISKGT